MSKSLLDMLKLAMAVEESGPNKEDFGYVMHNDNITEEEKQQVLERVALLGGYECLDD